MSGIIPETTLIRRFSVNFLSAAVNHISCRIDVYAVIPRGRLRAPLHAILQRMNMRQFFAILLIST
ncbi:MAG: hypothetical protein KAJ98_10745, partial [Spirochaetaceae bacterium]|nr:hypothetical protein [Spirochaetaceae bacterium]